MLRLPLALAAVLLVAVPDAAWAQGFRLMNGRNHPELEWKVAETEHFKIVFPFHLEGIEREAAAIAEETYDVLSANLGVGFEKKIPIYLSDEDEIANGMAIPLGDGYTAIWVHANESAELFTGSEKWLRKVLAHELAHIFHYRATRSRLGLFAYLFGNPRPSFWAEGLAQYQTERWDALRGERWLRTAVLGDALAYDDGRSAWNGRLLYAVGNSQVRFFAEQYGDSALADMLAYRRPVLFGLARVHDFNRAFRATTGLRYDDFYDTWERQINLHYNSLAVGLASTDSLSEQALPFQGTYVEDVKFSRDGGRLAALVMPSLERPVTQLYVEERATGRRRVLVEGSLSGPLAWSPSGGHIAYCRRLRTATGSWVHDLYRVNTATGETERLTVNRRVSDPTFSPDGRRLAFVSSILGTSNVYVLDTALLNQVRISDFSGDVQITGLAWHPASDRLAITLFDEAGNRRLSLLEVETGSMVDMGEGGVDFRNPVWSPDGSRLAVTSLDDGVPNVFTFDLADGGPGLRDAGSTAGGASEVAARRVTNQAAGASVRDWIRGESASGPGELVVEISDRKEHDGLFLIGAGHAPVRSTGETAPALRASWADQAPPRRVPERIQPDKNLVTRRYPYSTWGEIRHLATLAVPYYVGPGHWGLVGGTAWVEPLGKHLLLAYGNVSATNPREDSRYVVQYINNQFAPTLLFMVYRGPARLYGYGDHLLLERFTGALFGIYRPLDFGRRAYTKSRLDFQIAYGRRDPIYDERVEELPDELRAPEEAAQVSFQVSMRLKNRPPYKHDVIHPLGGHGALIRFRMGAGTVPMEQIGDYVRLGLLAYKIFPGPGLSRFAWNGRMESQHGKALAQDFIGFSRVDDVSFLPPFSGSTFFLGESERVRGYRRFVIGQHMAFSTLEYRIPVMPDLDTRLLGVVRLGRTTLSGFVDAGVVWHNRLFASDLTHQMGAGLEVKNLVRLGGFDLLHAVGAARPAGHLFRATTDYYYRVRAIFPF